MNKIKNVNEYNQDEGCIQKWSKETAEECSVRNISNILMCVFLNTQNTLEFIYRKRKPKILHRFRNRKRQ